MGAGLPVIRGLRFSAIGSQLPPRGVRTRRTVLNNVLLSPRTVNQIVRVLAPSTFCVNTRGSVCHTTLSLRTGKRPASLVAIAI